MLEYQNNYRTAVLVFANSSTEELKHKSIAKGRELFQDLTQRALCTVKKTGLPYFLLTEKEQFGKSFGERFVNAIKFVFEKGFDNVITIGNDTPHLKANDILKTSLYVSANKFVLGPSTDGGFYLMGLHKSQFNENTFRHLPWQTSSLGKAITGIIKSSNFEVVRLHALMDLDNLTDLKRIVNGFRAGSTRIIGTIISLIAAKKGTIHLHHNLISIYLDNSYFNKGSPMGAANMS